MDYDSARWYKPAASNGMFDFDTASAQGQRELRTSSTPERTTSPFPTFATTSAPDFPSDKSSRKPRGLPHSIHHKSTLPQESVVPAQKQQKDSMRLHTENQCRRIHELETKMNQHIPVSVAHFDQAMADLMRVVKPADNRDELAALHHRISELTNERDDARAEATQLGEAMENTVEKRCHKMKEDFDASMDAKIAESLVARTSELEEMKKDRDRLSNIADNLLKKLDQVESNYDSLLQREESLKDDLRAKISALQKTVRDMEEAIKARDTHALPPIRSSTRLADLAKEQELRHKRTIEELTKERNAALSQISAQSHYPFGKRQRRKQ